MTAQDMVDGMPPKTHRIVRIRRYEFNAMQMLKDILSLPQVHTAAITRHTKDEIHYHVISK